ncbi:MAG TPA: DNA primase, partial [Aliiroseovarius sp.]|nr:DNA primase [Aliiroseovarius sp.]
MSLPPGFLDELRTRTSLSQVVGRKVMWDARKSNQGKGDMWAPCPFHQEKTASFHVDDRQGYYYCFGCHAKGDAISFVRETENVSFMEAVEILAREVGLPMPARDPKAQEKADKSAQLVAVMEQAVQFFRLQLRTAAGAGARDYLAGRGLKEAALERWEIGFAPEGWQNLWDHLRGKGVAEELISAAGLAKESQKGGKPYDTFRNRIMFPIRDARGRAIAFGGRAMDPSDNAKYLNSPETLLFDKGRTLFNQAPARVAAGKGAQLVVAEGYMDVIALSEAGFEAALAPLGKAVTEAQLRLMWRIAPEPVVALDGDTAGLRAAMRLIDLALPLLEAGQSLRFALMPAGLDPDDVLRQQGRAAMQALIDGAAPMVDLLWQRETEGKVFDSPERKAALDRDLRNVIKKIADPSIRAHYGQAIKEKRWELFRAGPAGQHAPAQKSGWKPRGSGGWGKAPAPVRAETKASLLAAGSGAVQEVLREAVILATLIRHPALVDTHLAQLERLELSMPEHRAMLDVLLGGVFATPDAAEAAVAAEIGTAPVEKLFSLNHVRIAPSISRPDASDLAALCLEEELAKLEAERGSLREVEEAAADMEAARDEGLTWRLGQVAQAREKARRGQEEDGATFEIADSGALVDREEREALEKLLEQIEFGKKG